MLTKRNIISIILFILSFSARVFAQETGTLEIDPKTAIDYAYKNNLTVESARLSLEDKRFARDSSWNQFVPAISLAATLSHMNESQDLGLSDLYTALGLSAPPAVSQWNFTASVGAQLTVSLASFYNIRKAVLEYQSGVTGLAKAKSLLARDVQKQFYNLLLLQNRIKVAQTTVNNAQERYDQARVDYRNGLISEYKLLTTQVDLENAKPPLVQLQNAYSDAEMLFKFTIGVDLSRPIVLKGSLDITAREFDAKALLQKYANQRFDIIEAKQGIDTLQNSIDLSSAALYPSVTLGFTYDPTINGPFENDLFDPDNWAQQRGAVTISVTQLIDPLLPSSKTRVAIAELNTQLVVARKSLEQAYTNAELSITRIVRLLETSGTSIQSKEVNVRVAERAYKLALESYHAGGIDLLQVKDTEQALDLARSNLLQEKYNYLAGLLDLEYECNTTLNDLESNHE
ncbi:MAG: TolC family protein [Spirochaetia bacterium]